MARPPRCLLDDLSPAELWLDDAARHHLGRVLRLREGEPVELIDGEGGWARAAWRPDGRLQPGERRATVPRPARGPRLWVAPPKGPRLGTLIEKAVELGALELGLLSTRYAGPPPSPSRLERLQRKADEALLQCRGLHRLRLLEPRALAPLLADPTPRELWYGSAPEDGAPADAELFSHAADDRRLELLVGPEGGWHAEELAELAAAGARPVRTGARVLRVETAAMALLVLAQTVTER